MNHAANKPVYTVMADCGIGEFLWVKTPAYMTQYPGEAAVGANRFGLMDYRDDCSDVMSPALFDKFTEWAKWYMAGQPEDWEEPWDIDWESFNKEGQKLAGMLQAELGNSATVRYFRAWNDPARELLGQLLPLN